MTVLMSFLALILTILAVFSYQWITILPQLGIHFLYHLRLVRVLVAIIAIGLAGGAYALNPVPGQLVVLVVVLLLTPLSGFNHAGRFLVALDAPRHVAADAVELGADAQVLGLRLDGVACAWPLATLVPHHLVNDTVAGEPVLASW